MVRWRVIALAGDPPHMQLHVVFEHAVCVDGGEGGGLKKKYSLKFKSACVYVICNCDQLVYINEV